MISHSKEGDKKFIKLMEDFRTVPCIESKKDTLARINRLHSLRMLGISPEVYTSKINTHNTLNETLLLHCFWHLDATTVQSLIDAGVNVNFQNQFGDTLLIQSVRRGLFDTFRVLIACKDIDITIRTHRGETVCDHIAHKIKYPPRILNPSIFTDMKHMIDDRFPSLRIPVLPPSPSSMCSDEDQSSPTEDKSEEDLISKIVDSFTFPELRQRSFPSLDDTSPEYNDTTSSDEVCPLLNDFE